MSRGHPRPSVPQQHRLREDARRRGHQELWSDNHAAQPVLFPQEAGSPARLPAFRRVQMTVRVAIARRSER